MYQIPAHITKSPLAFVRYCLSKGLLLGIGQFLSSEAETWRKKQYIETGDDWSLIHTLEICNLFFLHIVNYSNSKHVLEKLLFKNLKLLQRIMCQYLDHPATKLNFPFSLLIFDRAPFILKSDSSHRGPQNTITFYQNAWRLYQEHLQFRN